MKLKSAILFVLICVPFTVQAQSPLDDQVTPLGMATPREMVLESRLPAHVPPLSDISGRIGEK